MLESEGYSTSFISLSVLCLGFFDSRHKKIVVLVNAVNFGE